MKTSSALMSILSLLAITAVVSCASHVPYSSSSIEDGVASAIESSALGGYTKTGCLSSLKNWSTKTTVASPREISSGLFYLGDSYLSYYFAYLVSGHPDPSIIVQTSDSTKRLRITALQGAELAGLVSSARGDPAPQRQTSQLHTTCVVFLDTSGNYFVVYPDETDGSMRRTDRAIAFLDQITSGAP